MTDLYSAMKSNAYSLAVIVTGKTNPDAEAEGFTDVFDLIMSDSNNMRQLAFLSGLEDILSEK